MKIQNLGESVRQRLLNKAKAEGRPFQEVLQYFAMERFLYRLSKSGHADRFILKVALLLTAWRAPESRPTLDIDLEGRTSNNLEHIQAFIDEACAASVTPDGLVFEAPYEIRPIKEDAEYEGVRIRFRATLAGARIPMQIDVGFGDVIVPAPIEIVYPAMLELPPPVLLCYSRESVVAEKLEALTALGVLNSRLKDYYDTALLARMYSFQGTLLVSAIRSTFENRGTPVSPNPAGLSEAFVTDPARAVQWRAFLRRSRFEGEPGFADVMTEVRAFALPALRAAAARKTLSLN